MAAPIFKTKAQDINPVFSQENLSDFTSLPQLIAYSTKDFMYWWYVRMPVFYLLSLRRIATVINDKFSISLLLSTFFTPWHRDSSLPGYLIGITVRILYLPIALFVLLLTIVGYLVFIIFWLITPMAAILLIIFSPFLKIS